MIMCSKTSLNCCCMQIEIMASLQGRNSLPTVIRYGLNNDRKCDIGFNIASAAYSSNERPNEHNLCAGMMHHKSDMGSIIWVDFVNK